MKLDLSAEAELALEELCAGKTCIPTEAVVQELGRAGLAYRRDLRSRSRRIALTDEGIKWMRSTQHFARKRLGG